jgi:hypothetical protein
MRICTTAAALTALAGFASHVTAQELVTFHWSFTEVVANSTTPATGPLAGNSAIDPGEGAEIRLTISFTPGVGSPATYTPPPGTGQGTIGGFASAFFDLLAPAGHGGVFHNRGPGPGLPPNPSGTIEPDAVRNVSIGQFPLPGQPAPPANPIVNIWRVRWTPTDYTARIVEFTAAKSISTSGTGAALYIEYTGNPQEPAYLSKSVAADFGSLQIPVVPAPTTLVIFSAGLLAAARRRR